MMAELPDLWERHRTRRSTPTSSPGPKGWLAPGALDTEVRVRVLDALDIDAQLVFPTFSLGHFARSRDLDVLYGGTRALNRAMTAFCAGDARLKAGRLPAPRRPGPRRRRRSTRPSTPASPPSGCRPRRRATSRRPTSTSTRCGPAWPRPACPFVLHVGGGKLLPKAFHKNGRPRPNDWLGGGENLRAKDFPVLHHSPERFLACLALDGVFERHPQLRGAAIELGATWVPGLLRNVDHAHRSFAKFEPLLQALAAAARRSTSAARCASRRSRSRTPRGSSSSAGPSCSCSPPTTRTPRVAGARSRSSARRWPRFDDDARERFFWRNGAELFGLT